jgi:preprotein translocase SecA subunit
MLNWLKKLTGSEEEKTRKQYQSFVDQINSLEPEFEALTDIQLREKTDEFRLRLDEGEDLDALLPEAFATVREASRRTIGMRHYDVQLIGGVVLHQGRIAEMRTGEGKTLVATLPMYLNALSGEGVHLVTVNDYLARRDAGWMGPVYHLLGMQIGFIGHSYSALFDPEYVDVTGSLDDERLVHWRPCSRREAYEADITYGTNNEFGFDYLRDNMVHSFESISQRKHNFAIVDEVDNILIDEARTPLIISGPASQSSSQYARFARLVDHLKAGTVSPDEVKKGAEPDGDVLIDLKSRSVVLTEEGLSKVESQVDELGPGESIYDPPHSELTHYLENALKAKFIFHLDRDYVVKDGEVIIVDEFTGRMMPGRRWSDGLHQAVEAKEGVEVRRESVTYATITFQNYFRMYNKLSGMTGTAATEKEEFAKIYNLEVSVVPTNKPCIREDHPDQIYRNEEAKFNALINDISQRAIEGQPILVGTTAVETSERLSKKIEQDLKDLLRNNTIRLHVLNAKQNADEAALVAQAGQPGTITIATNMAGRGTDILLGGNPEALAARYLKEHGVERNELEELAHTLLGPQKGQKQPVDAMIERSNGRLDQSMLQELQKLHDEFEDAIDQMERQGEPLFLMNKLLNDVPSELFEQKRELVRAVLDGNMARARRFTNEFEELHESKIAEIQHMHTDYAIYRNNRRDRPTFLAGKLFDRIYTARSRLVQLTLRGNLDEAHKLVQETPGLNQDYIEAIVRIQNECEENRAHIKDAGGLHVVGTERHEARRIDNQLRGRSGRQGDPGSSRFYLSLEDDLMKRFGRMDTLRGFMEKMGVDDDVPIEARVISKSIESAQTRVEGFNFDIRKHTFDYDTVMNKQREVIYERRLSILEEADEQRRIQKLLERYFKPDQMLQEVREEIRATLNLSDDIARRRLERLLPDVAFDLHELRAIRDDQMTEMLEPLVKQQQQHSLPLLLDELSDMVELPDDAETHLRQVEYAEARRYVIEQWREQREGGLEDRIKELFDKEFLDIIERYMVNYDSWLRGRITEAVGEATNPATDQVSVPLVRRRLATILPEVNDLDPEELAEIDAEHLQRLLESKIVANRERGHNIRLMSQDLLALVPLLPSPNRVVWSIMPAPAMEHERDQYLHLFHQALDMMTAALPDTEQERIRQQSDEKIHEYLEPLIHATRATTQDRAHVMTFMVSHITDVVGEVLDQLETHAIQEMLTELLDHAFDRWRDTIGNQQLTKYQRTLMLQTIDREWQNYLTAMDDMRQGIGLQAIGQRDPLIQYQTQGYRMFNELLENIDHTIVSHFFRQLPDYQRHLEQYRIEQERQAQATRAGYEMVSGGTQPSRGKSKGVTVKRDMPKVGPNEPCPCGSGKKYKHCHGRRGNEATTARGRDAEPVAVGSNGEEIEEEQAVPAGRPKGRSTPPPPAASAQTPRGKGGGSSRKKKRKR